MATSPSITISSISNATITDTGSTVSSGNIYWSVASQAEADFSATKANYYADTSGWYSRYYWSGTSGSKSFDGLSNIVTITAQVTKHTKCITKSSSGTFVTMYADASAAQTACDNVAGSASYVYEYSYGNSPVNGASGYCVYRYDLSIDTISETIYLEKDVNVSNNINIQSTSTPTSPSVLSYSTTTSSISVTITGLSSGDSINISAGGNGVSDTATSSGAKTLTVIDLSPGTTYTVYVRVNGALISSFSVTTKSESTSTPDPDPDPDTPSTSDPIHRKIEGIWRESTNVYRKVSGSWQSISIDDAESLISSRLIKKGHHVKKLQGYNATCIGDGITEGYQCTICGTMLKEQVLIPMGSHDYISTYSKNVCSICGHIEDMGYVELVHGGYKGSLNQAKTNFAATTVGNYAIFAGKYNSTSATYTTDAYNDSITKVDVQPLDVTRTNLAGVTVGNYAIFAGGGYLDPYKTVDVYDQSLTKITATELSVARSSLAATTNGDYAIFAGGYADSTSTNIIEIYDSSLTKIEYSTTLSKARNDFGATTVGDYAIFAGGYTSSSRTNVVDILDKSLTLITGDPLDYSRDSIASTSVGNYALFAGGCSGTSYYTTIDVYDKSLTKMPTLNMVEGKDRVSGITLGNYAIFTGGYRKSSNSATKSVDVYDQSLTIITTTSLSTARYGHASTSVGDYAIFAGGYSSADSSNIRTVEVYKIQVKE